MLALTLFVLFVFTCLWWYWNNDQHQQRSRCKIQQSNGTFDQAAKDALRHLNRIEIPSVQDDFLHARILDLNVNEGRTNNMRMLNDLVHRYENVLKNGGDDIDWFEHDQIENFVTRNWDILELNPHYSDFIESVLTSRPEKVANTIRDVKKLNLTKKETFKEYTDNNVANRSDDQNVHDSAVNEQLRQIFHKLKNEAGKPSDCQKSLEFLIKTKLDSVKQKKALKALSELKSGKFNSSIGASESEIADVVWSHAKTDLAQDGVLSALTDMSTDGNDVVCSSGRCGRMIESLAHQSPNVMGLLTKEQIRNDALKTSNEILQSTIKRFRDDPMSDLNEVARSYDDLTVKSNEGDEKAFKKIVTDEITRYMFSNYAGKLTDRDASEILSHCILAVETI
jgi:hypothetical protein